MSNPATDRDPRGFRASSKKTVKQFSYSAVDAKKLVDTVQALSAAGCAIMFSTTRDGGTASVLVLSGNEKTREYASTPGELETLLDELVEFFG